MGLTMHWIWLQVLNHFLKIASLTKNSPKFVS